MYNKMQNFESDCDFLKISELVFVSVERNDKMAPRNYLHINYNEALEMANCTMESAKELNSTAKPGSRIMAIKLYSAEVGCYGAVKNGELLETVFKA